VVSIFSPADVALVALVAADEDPSGGLKAADTWIEWANATLATVIILSEWLITINRSNACS